MDKMELLYDHYKETFSIIKDTIIQRNRFFVMVFLVMTFQFLFASSPDSVSCLITSIIQNQYKIDISNQMAIMESFLWLVLLYLTMRYYQVTIYVEKQYSYIYSIEEELSKITHIKFNRESGNYLLNYPQMNNFVDFLYKRVFPMMYCFIISYKIFSESYGTKITLLLIINIILFISCFILTIFYMKFLKK